MSNWMSAWGSSGIARRLVFHSLPLKKRGDPAVHVAHLVGAQRLVPLVEEVAEACRSAAVGDSMWITPSVVWVCSQ